MGGKLAGIHSSPAAKALHHQVEPLQTNFKCQTLESKTDQSQQHKSLHVIKAYGFIANH
jgi:hypothetical protein